MLRNITKCIVTALCCSMLLCSTAYAFSADGPKQPEPIVEESGGGGGSGEPGPPSEPKEPSILSYTPVVTALHSVNAGFANDGQAVYFLPRLEDFPVDLKSTCADVTTDDGVRHQFALVYDGYFDNEVVYNLAEADNTDTEDVTRLHTSKKVYSMTDNSRALNLLGYDLLLSDEDVTIRNEGDGLIYFDYYPTLVGTSELTAKTVIMDLYKAVGQWEWDIKITYGIDESLAVNTSPIMQDIEVLTNDEVPGGIDTKEGATWVWATRTNPDLYWERCQRDAIFDGGAHLYTKPEYVGNDVSVTFSKGENQTVSMAEFCSIARAIMELYGEPVLTELEKTYMTQAFALELPASNFDKEQLEDIEYLAAKGIIDPTNIDFTDAVTFADIEELLLRIADPDSRLTFDLNVNLSSWLVQEGYVEAPVSTPDLEIVEIERIANPYDNNMYDYFIEAVDGYTNFYLRKLSGIEREAMRPPEEPPAGPAVASLNVRPAASEEDTETYVFACNKLIVSSDSIPESTSGSGYFTYNGMVEINDKYYYHLQVNQELSTVTVKYDYDPELETLDTLKQYTLPNAYGGVYEYSTGSPVHKTFDEAGFSDEFLDKNRATNDYNNLSETESYLSSKYTWMRLTIKASDFTKSKLKDCGIDLNGDKAINDEDVQFVDLLDNGGKIIDTPLEMSYNGSPLLAYVYENSANGSDVITVIIQSRLTEQEFTSKLILSVSREFDKSSAYYRHSDNSLLVSYDYLKNKGLVSGLTDLDNGNGISLISSKLGTNIVLRDDLNIITVGDTMYSGEGETLYHYVSPKDLYINYRACIGWTSQYLVFNQDGNLLPVTVLGSNTRSLYVGQSVKSLTNLYPASVYNVGYTTVKVNGGITAYEGFDMNGSNALGSYMLVSDGTNSMDYLFVWHRQNVKDNSGNIHTYDDASARAKFKELTAISLNNVSDAYGLVMYSLNRKGGIQHGFRYVTSDFYRSYTQGTCTVGWLYNPPSYDSWEKALDAYVKADKQLLPIAKVDGKYVNLNMNTCSDIPDGEQLPIGRLPYSMHFSSKSTNDNKMGKINEHGMVVEDSTTYDDLSGAVIYSSPVGVFQQLKGLGAKSLESVGSTNFYFGSSKAKYQNGKITIKDKIIEATGNSPVICSYKGLGSSSIWVVNAEETSLGDILDELNKDLSVVITEPDNLIDWGAYKFGRLVKNIDDWSSIALIFVLNVLPRIGMLLFFVLMLLSMIKNVKPWRMFCERVFDVYSFLTMGKQNVDTIDTKKVMVVSLICFALFLIIMDGQLFNFIIWVCKWFVILFQR